jgi:hypothetical protein
MTVSVEKPAPSTVMVCPFCITLLIMICAPIGTDTPLLLSVNWPMPPLLLMRNELGPVGALRHRAASARRSKYSVTRRGRGRAVEADLDRLVGISKQPQDPTEPRMRLITGTRWNGPVFFRLRKGSGRQAEVIGDGE